MLSSMRFSRLACVLAVLSWTSLVQAADILRITEVMSNSGTGGTADWFELTNYGTTTVNLLGYKMDDNSFAFGTAVSLATSSTATPPTMSIAAGESVIFIEGTTVATSAVAGFRTAWGLPSSVQVNGYAGAGAGVDSAFSQAGVASTAYAASFVLSALGKVTLPKVVKPPRAPRKPAAAAASVPGPVADVPRR